MGIGFVFLIYLVILAVLVVPAIAICAGLGYFLVRKSSRRIRRIIVLTACVLPVVGCIYLVGCIIIMAIVGLATGRDVGFGDGFDIPLHNHYRWSAIDTTDSAEVYDREDRRATDGQGGTHIEEDNRNAFANVLELQEEGDWLAGAYGSHDSRFDNPSGKQVADHWFLFNTRTHQRVDASSETELQAAATAQGLHLHMQSSDAFYSSHRLTWIDGIAVIILLIPPVGGIIFLWKRTRKLIREDRNTSGPSFN
ncbi:MAG: hypothetical protein LV480_12785 [Methylacidiphilales bacterium]|nr:hypothetical protein [Candidatus Methylacidiphilales bacterium]